MPVEDNQGVRRLMERKPNNPATFQSPQHLGDFKAVL